MESTTPIADHVVMRDRGRVTFVADATASDDLLVRQSRHGDLAVPHDGQSGTPAVRQDLQR